jgi:SAM-dependent methyltransferase
VSKSNCKLINTCRLCSSTRIKKVFNLGKTPLANSYTKTKLINNTEKYPLNLNLCLACGHLQLTHSINPKKLFNNYLYQTNTSKQNFLHFKNYSEDIKKKLTLKNKINKILDIASNDGTFLNFFNKNSFFRLGIDPAKNLKEVAKQKGINQIDKFFTFNLSKKLKKKYGKFDCITANHVCAHVENLNDFFKGVNNLLDCNGLFIFEISYRVSVLKKLTFDTIYHEHLDYHALKPLVKFVKKFGLNLINFKITSAQGGSLRVYVSKNNNLLNNNKIKKQILKETKMLHLFKLSTYRSFEQNINLCKNKIHKILNNFDKKKIIVGYGAAAKTTTLLNYFKLYTFNIKYIFDDNKLKQNMYLPGSHIKILDPRKLNNIKFSLIIIFAWNYSKEIIKKIKKQFNTHNKKIKFLIPFPVPRIIE